MNLNPIDFNYIDGENIYPIQDYIDEQLNNVIINEIYTSNIKLNDNKILNNVLYYVGACNLNQPTNHLILSNNYNFGEIKFNTFFKYANSNQIGTKIDYTGKLLLYHNYSLLQPTILEGYYDIDYELAQLKTDGVATDIQLTLIEGNLVTINNDIVTIEGEILTVYGAINQLNQNILLLQKEIEIIAGELEQRVQFLQGTQNVTELVNSFDVFYKRDRNLIGNTINSAIQFGIPAIGLGVVGGIFGFLYNDRMSNMAYNIQSSNFQITTGDRSNLIYQTNSQNALYANEYITGTCNLNLYHGFINSNIITQQFIPNLNTNVLSISNINISNVLYTNSNICSNGLYINSNYIFNSSNLNFNYTSNIANRKYSLLLPQSNFWYDGDNALYCYDLNIEKYVPALNLGDGYKTRAFRISTFVDLADWNTKNNLLYQNEFINKPETLTIYMNNCSNNFGIKTPNNNYTNGIILGKNYNTNIGYWNFLSSNYITINNFSITGTGNTINNVTGSSVYKYFSFINNGTLTLNSSINCDILVVGGGGSGGSTIGGGGGGGAVVYITNATINPGTYNVVVGAGGPQAAVGSINGNKGGNSSFAGIIAEGGGASASYPNNGNIGGSGGGAGADEIGVTDPIGGAVGTQSTLNGYTGIIYGNKGGDGLNRTGDNGLGAYLGGGGGGGAGEIGQNGNPNYNGAGGRGGNGIQINITGTNYYWAAGGGGAQYASRDGGVISRPGNGGLGGGGGGTVGNGAYSGSGGTGGINNGGNGSGYVGGNGGANTGSGGGGGSWNNPAGGAGGSGIVIIRFIPPEDSGPKSFNYIRYMAKAAFTYNLNCVIESLT